MSISVLCSVLLFYAVAAAAVFEDVSPGSSVEQVWLMNCVDKKGVRRSELALYDGFPDGPPVSTIVTRTMRNATLPWAHANLTEQFPNGPVFATSEFGGPAAPTGITKLGLRDLACQPNGVEGLYTSIEGFECSSVFQCAGPRSPAVSMARPLASPTRLKPISPAQRLMQADVSATGPSDATQIIFKAYDEKVIVNGKLNVNVIFWNVWGNRDAYYFSGRGSGFGSDGCSVTYTGHGDIPWLTTNGLATTLLATASGRNFLMYSTYKRRECDDTCERPGHAPTCCSWTVNTYWQTHIPSHVDFQVINVPPDGSGRNPSDQGDMSYTISCPVKRSIGCILCTALGDILSAGSLIPEEIGAGFQAANLVTKVSCQIAGC